MCIDSSVYWNEGWEVFLLLLPLIFSNFLQFSIIFCNFLGFFSAGILKLAALIFAFLLAVFLAFQLLEINMDFKLSSVICEQTSVFFTKVTVTQQQSCYFTGNFIRATSEMFDADKVQLLFFKLIFTHTNTFFLFQPKIFLWTKAVSIFLFSSL